jgi:hypothetical protein
LFGAALLLAINAGILVNLVHNDADDARPPAAGIMPSPNSLPDGPDTSPFNPRSKTQPIIILGKPDAFVPLGGVAARAGIGGNPLIRYLWSSGGGPVIQVSGIPEGTGISYSGASMEQQSCPECANDTSAAPPFPGHAADTSYATKIALDGVGGRIVLRAERAPSRGFIVVLVTWIPDLE